jgi:hypothetical protein
VGERTYPSKSSLSVVAPSPLRARPLRVADWLVPTVVSLRTVTPALARPFLINYPALLTSSAPLLTRSTPTPVRGLLGEYAERVIFILSFTVSLGPLLHRPSNDTQHAMLCPGREGEGAGLSSWPGRLRVGCCTPCGRAVVHPSSMFRSAEVTR